MKTQPVYLTFEAKPKNFAKIDETISRSAQPSTGDFIWLKEQGITDIINLCTKIKSDSMPSEQKTVEELGMKYHNIPTITFKPTEKKVQKFLRLIDSIKEKNGKIHVHCKAGADRTGMYVFIYKALQRQGTLAENEAEWLSFGHNTKLFPNLRMWAKEFIKKYPQKITHKK